MAHGESKPPECPPIPRSDNPATQAAFEFGWQSYLQFGRAQVTPLSSFEAVEKELEQQWLSRQPADSKTHQPWQQAREAARDAWDRVQEAMVSGEPKASAR